MPVIRRAKKRKVTNKQKRKPVYVEMVQGRKDLTNIKMAAKKAGHRVTTSKAGMEGKQQVRLVKIW